MIEWAEMTGCPVEQLTTEAVDELMKKIQRVADRKAALETLFVISYRELRIADGDEWIRGFLEGALKELQNAPPDVAAVCLH